MNQDDKDVLLDFNGSFPGVAPVKPDADNIQLYIGPTPHPVVRLKSLEGVLNAGILRRDIPLDVTVTSEPATHVTSLSSICIEVNSPALTESKDGLLADAFGRVISLTGRVVAVFETKISREQTSIQQLRACEAIPLAAGQYRLDVAVKDANSDRMGTSVSPFRLALPEHSNEANSNSGTTRR